MSSGETEEKEGAAAGVSGSGDRETTCYLLTVIREETSMFGHHLHDLNHNVSNTITCHRSEKEAADKAYELVEAAYQEYVDEYEDTDEWKEEHPIPERNEDGEYCFLPKHSPQGEFQSSITKFDPCTWDMSTPILCSTQWFDVDDLP